MKIYVLDLYIYTIFQLSFIYILEICASNREVRIVNIGDDIYCHDSPNLTISFSCDQSKPFSYLHIVEIMTLIDNVLKFTKFAPVFNYSCQCIFEEYQRAVILELSLIIQEVPPIRECEMTHNSRSQISGVHIYIMNIVIFCIFIGICILSAFLATDVAMRSSNQSNLMEILGFDKAWRINDMIVPPIVVLAKGDGKDRFYRVVALSKEADKNLSKFRYSQRPTDANFKNLLNLVNESSRRKSIKIKLDPDIENAKNKVKYRNTKRNIILQELHNKSNARNNIKLVLAGINPPNTPTTNILKRSSSSPPIPNVLKRGLSSPPVPNVLKRCISKGEFHKQITSGNMNLTHLTRKKGGFADLAGFDRTSYIKPHTIALTAPRSYMKYSPPELQWHIKDSYVKESKNSTDEFKYKLQKRNSSTKDTSEVSYMLTKTMSDIMDLKDSNSSIQSD